MLTDAELKHRHYYHTPTDAARKLHETVNTLTYAVAADMERMLPEGREKSIVHTKLEEVRMWANASIAHNHDKL
jgi:hypothetical protein